MANTEVFIEGRQLDVSAGLDFSFNYQVSDIRNPETRQTEFSKTVRCPGTESNNALFGHIFEVTMANPYVAGQANIGVNFNPNKKAAASVSVDTLPVFDGVMQLRRVIVMKEAVEYEVVFIGRLSNLFTRIADYRLDGFGNDGLSIIDWSDLDHDYTRANIITSWSPPYGIGYAYPMIDYGRTLEYDNAGSRVFHVQDFRPTLYAKEILDRVFAYANSTYESTLLEGSGFARLVVTSNQKLLQSDADAAALREFKASTSSVLSSGDITFGSAPDSSALLRFNLPTDNDSTLGNYDNGGNFDTSLARYTVPATNYYTFRAVSEFNLNRFQVTANRIYGGSFTIGLQICRSSAGQFSVIAENFVDFALVGNPASFDQTRSCETASDEIVLLAGDILWVRLAWQFGNLQLVNQLGQALPVSDMFNDFTLTLNQPTSIWNEAGVELFEGDLVSMIQVVPKMTMKEYLISIFRMFNLHITPSKDVEDHYIIQTWDEFYQSGTVRDWTYKLDHASPIEIQPMGLLAARQYIFSYEPDGDYYNKRYEGRFNRVYGSRRFDVDNDFVPKSNEITVAFSATPLVDDGVSGRKISKLIDEDISQGAQPTECNPRILYFNPALPCQGWRFQSYFGAVVNLISYPYAGHLNNPDTPTFDLNWGIPFELYYTAAIYTNANLFKLYHISQYREIIDKDSKLMTGYFRLTTTDIQKLDFRDTIVIDNQYWRLNRVMDYNPFKDGLTKVELLKVLQLEPFAAIEVSTGRGKSGGGTFKLLEIEQSPTVESPELANNGNRFPPFQGRVDGRGNFIHSSVTSFEVKGDRNRIGAGTSNVLIIGSDNVVGAGLHNVTIINGTGVTVSRSNVTVINGAETVLFGGIIEGSRDEVRAIGAPSPIFVIDGGGDVVSDTFADYHNDINGGSDSV